MRLRERIAGSELYGRGREVVVTGARSFLEKDLLSYASAIAFQTLFALVPALLAGIALLGFLDLEGVWQDELRPRAREQMQEDSFSVLDRTVSGILGQQRGTWLTFGLAFALWQISGAVRATMAPLNAVYEDSEERVWWKRFLVSLLLSPAIALCIAVALAAIHFVPLLLRDVDLPGIASVSLTFLRWLVAGALLFLANWLIVSFAPARSHSAGWTSLGTLFVVVAWILASLGFAAYATTIADYGSLFGSLASFIVLMIYLYLSALALLAGVQLDACVRAQARGQSPSSRYSAKRSPS